MSESDSPPADLDRFCVSCGYNLRNLPSDRCPECGTTFDPNQSAAPQIPWSYRRSLGRRKAFWRTVRLATFKTKDFAREIDRPVSLADAKSFRRVVALHAFVPIAIAASVLYFDMLQLVRHPWYLHDVFGSIVQWLGWPVMLVSIWLFLIQAMGVCSYFFHPKWLPKVQQNRAVAMSYYACAPWAYLLPAAVIAAAMLFIEAANGHDAPIQIVGIVSVVVVSIVAVQSLLIWFLPYKLLRRRFHCGSARLLLLNATIPVALALLAVLTVGLINLAYWGGALMLMTLI